MKSIPITVGQATIVDQVNTLIFRAAPWRWAQASLTSNSGVLQLVNGVQDYGIGTTTGAGFYQMLRVRISRTDTSPWIVREKDFTNWLAPNLEIQGGVDSIQAIAWEPVTSQLRLDRAASVPAGTTAQIDGEYIFQPVKITLTSTLIVFPDQYFSVAIEGLKARWYLLGDDKRADKQDAVFRGLLAEMVRQEDYADAQGTRFPEMGFGQSKGGNPGLYGYY